MPPKKRGHNLTGKNQLFRHAVEHVHVGIGHSVLGNLSLQLAASGSTEEASSSRAHLALGSARQDALLIDRPAFYMELHEQLLSHTSKDFKKFRWEVLELCETKPLFHHNHRQIAEKLLVCLLSRTGGSFSNKSKNDIHKKRAGAAAVESATDDGTSAKGLTGEGFEAFVRLTIAFARDMQGEFLKYFEVFHTAVNAGLYDKNGRLIVDTSRLQLVFAVQAAWCREMAPHWAAPQHRALVCGIVRLYVAQMRESKEYIRRLAAEVLAGLGRMCRPLVPLILQEAIGEVLASFERGAVGRETARLGSAQQLSGEGPSEEDEDGNDGESTQDTVDGARVWTQANLRAYTRNVLPTHPIRDGLVFFAAELIRGIRGSLNSCFEEHYVRLLQCFLVISSEARDTLGQRGQPLAASLNDEVEDESDETGARRGSVGGPDQSIYSTRWVAVLCPSAATAESTAEDSTGAEGRTCTTPECVAVARELVRELGTAVLSSALETLLYETRKNSGIGAGSSSDEEDDDDDVENEESGEGVVALGSGGDLLRPSHRLLATVAACMQPMCPHSVRLLSALLSAASYSLWGDRREVPTLKSVAAQLRDSLRAEEKFVEASPSSVLLPYAASILEMTQPLCVGSYIAHSEHSATLQRCFLPVGKAAVVALRRLGALSGDDAQQCETAQVTLFAFAQDVLQRNYSLCLSEERRLAEEVLVNGNDAAQAAEYTTAGSEEDEDNYVEEGDVGDFGSVAAAKRRAVAQRREKNAPGAAPLSFGRPSASFVIQSKLTPLALTLLHTVCSAAWQSASGDLAEALKPQQPLTSSKVTEKGGKRRKAADAAATMVTAFSADRGESEYVWMALRQRGVERAVLLARIANDRTEHMACSPLQQLLRLRPAAPPKAASSTTAVGAQEAKAGAGEEMAHCLAQLLLHLARHFVAARERSHDDATAASTSTGSLPLLRPRDTTELLLCALPLISSLAQFAPKAGNTSGGLPALQDAFLAVLQSIQTSNDSISSPVGPEVHSLYAHISSLMIHIASSSSPAAFASPSSQRVKMHSGAAAAARAELEATSLRHLSDTIVMLAKGFAGDAAHQSELARVQLVRGAEVLLRSLLACLGLQSLNAGEGAAAAATLLQLSSVASRRALATLKQTLSTETQTLFVEAILLEALVAPAQALRILSLRLLRMLCHPDLAEATERLHGLAAVDPMFFTALLQAEEYNPLSQTGNLDGVKQALARITFAAETGAIVDPLQRRILSRAMIGLLYVKFSGTWTAAQRILAALVRQERTSLLAAPASSSLSSRHKEEDELVDELEEEDDGDGAAEDTPARRGSRGSKLEPVVWDTVITRYAHLLVFGDVVSSRRANDGAGGGGGGVGNDDDDDGIDGGVVAGGEVSSSERAAAAMRLLDGVEGHYHIILTNQQRNEKGELASKAFSSAQYSASAETLVDATVEDGEVLSWRRHWGGQHREGSSRSAAAASTAALFAKSTDRATLAQSFLTALGDMVKSGSAMDRKLCLVESVLQELVAIQRNEHPSGLTQLRRLDERIVLAMRACSLAPSTVLSAGQRTRLSVDVVSQLDARSATLQILFTSYLSDASAKLQSAAIDNLKRLKVEPFFSYHAQLAPYTDSTKNLFAFLSSFHVESDIPEHSRADYISAALAISLPKLITKVSKEKRKDQAMLSRRVMGFLSHLTPSTDGDVDAITVVLDKLVQRLIFERMAPSTEAVQVEAFDFLHEWRRRVEARENHCARRLDRMMKQLLNTTRLLESLLHAAGRQFSYVRSCLHLMTQAYLLACKQHLRAPLVSMIASSEEEGEDVNETGLAVPRMKKAWAESVMRSLSSGALNLTLAQLRRATLTVVTLLFEQFPEEVMEAAVEEAKTVAPGEQPLLVRYVSTLSANSQGITQEATTSAPGGAGGHVTPILRMICAWVGSPTLLPLLSVFPREVTLTFAEVFAVNPQYSAASATSTVAMVHRAPTKAVYEALRAVTDILKQGSEPLDMAVLEILTPPFSRGEPRRKAGAKKRVVLLQDAFITPHVVPILTSLYELVLCGTNTPADGSDHEVQEARRDVEDEEEEGAGGAGEATEGSGRADASSDNKKQPQRRQRGRADGNKGGSKRDRASVMSFSVPMWREVIKTVSLLTTSLSARATTDTHIATMLGKLLEITIKFVTHPVCIADASTAVMASEVVAALTEELPAADSVRHGSAMIHLFNVVANPRARLILCKAFESMAARLVISDSEGRYGVPAAKEVGDSGLSALQEQVAAAGRAVACLNSFEDNETLERYDFELRYHAYHSLIDFFHTGGSQGGSSRAASGATRTAGSSRCQRQQHRDHSATRARSADTARHERQYTGDQHIHIPLDPLRAPVLCVEAFNMLVANAMFFLRDPESTIRAMSSQLIHAMLRYATSQGDVEASAAIPYETLVLECVVRREMLSSLRRGVVSRSVQVRNDHMSAFGVLGRYYPAAFPSFACLYAADGTQSFFYNVGHVQPKCRLHALAILRREAAGMHVRDLLRVFVPFLMSSVKDFAQGKRDLQNLTEGKAKGYCDAVLATIAAISEKLPWEAYYRVLTLFLSNASANAALRMPMLRGVVQVLNHFHFLDEEEGEDVGDKVSGNADAETREAEENDDDDGDVEDDDPAVLAEVRAKRRQFRHARITHVLEADIIPQLFEYITEDKRTKKAFGLGSDGIGNMHSITALRREQAKEDKAKNKNAILQLPVAIAITKIVKKFPETRFNVYVEHLLDEIVKKLRTKHDKQRESARRILGAMLQETGPSKLKFVITTLKNNLIHGYQLHVLGYTVVTLLYQLYEPHSTLLSRGGGGGRQQHSDGGAASRRGRRMDADPVQEALSDPSKRQRLESAEDNGAVAKKEMTKKTMKASAEDEDAAVEKAEEELIRQLNPHKVGFEYKYGVECLTAMMDDLLVIFLDDYVGEVGMQKEQVEVMSTMMEVKHNRALQGFALLARHCHAGVVLDTFLQRITWVLTPPSDTSVSIDELHGSARARAYLVEELRSKYLSNSKNAGADLYFVQKIRLLAVRVARSLMANPTAEVQLSFEKVRDLLAIHNARREEKISAFEAKDGTRRIRGNAHIILHRAERRTRKEQFEANLLVAPTPERVDVDFSTHTVLATQQKQKLRAYKGRYGKEIREAAKDFYREDPVTAVVLDTLDEFLLKYLLSVLKRVLGIGKERHYTKAAVRLDLLRRRAHASSAAGTMGELDGDDAADADEGATGSGEEGEVSLSGNDVEEGEDGSADSGEEDGEDADSETLEPQALGDGDEDALDLFVAAQEEAAAEEQQQQGSREERSKKKAVMAGSGAGLTNVTDLTAAFTREHRGLLESLVKVVLTTLRGEGSDPVVANALDSLLALVSLRPPLDVVSALEHELFDTITSFFARGGAIKQRAMRVCSAVIAHQKFTLTPEQASRLLQLTRAEIMDRSEFLPMALGLLYAVLGKHVHVTDVYDLMDIVTEMLVHLGAKRVIRGRCALILVRFLTEYKLTPDKFRSHIDLFCKNLDYPDLSGRLALLDLLDTLIQRLPTAVLRAEAPVLFVPLAASTTSSEWRESREKAGGVLQNLVKNAGVDVLVPLLSARMDVSQPRNIRTTAMQTWAVLIPAIAASYELPSVQQPRDSAEDENSFSLCCNWSLPMVLSGCLYDQIAAAGRDKSHAELSTRAREKHELKGWTYIYYSLRCAEAMATAVPGRFYEHAADSLVPWLVERLITHAHPWVQAAALRLLRGYCYAVVEARCAYLQDDWVVLSSSSAFSDGKGSAVGDGDDGVGSSKAAPFVLELDRCPARLAEYERVFMEVATALKRLVARVGLSDVSNEKYTAHRAIHDRYRAEALKVMVFLSKALTRIALAMSLRFGGSAQTERFLSHQYALVRRQIQSITAPILRQKSVVNYMVRCATITQFTGGFISVLPRLAPPRDEEAEIGGDEDAQVEGLMDRYNAAARSVAQRSIQGLRLAQSTIAPLLAIGVAATPLSRTISMFAHQATNVVRQQLEDRRDLFSVRVAPAPLRQRRVTAALASTEASSMTQLQRQKRRREDEEDAEERDLQAGDGGDEDPTLDAVLAGFITTIDAVRETKRVKQIRREVKVAQKRSRRQMTVEGKRS